MSDFEDEILDPETAYLIAHPSASDPALPYHSPFARARARIDRTLRTAPAGSASGAGDLTSTGHPPPDSGLAIDRGALGIPDSELANILGVIADLRAAGELHLAAEIERAAIQLGEGDAFQMPGPRGNQGAGTPLDWSAYGPGGHESFGTDPLGLVSQDHGQNSSTGYNPWTMRGPDAPRGRASRDVDLVPLDTARQRDEPRDGHEHAGVDGGTDAGSDSATTAGTGTDAGSDAGPPALGSEAAERWFRWNSDRAAFEAITGTEYPVSPPGPPPRLPEPDAGPAGDGGTSRDPANPDAAGPDGSAALARTLLPGYLRPHDPLSWTLGPGANLGPDAEPVWSRPRQSLPIVPRSDEPARASASREALMTTARRLRGGAGPGPDVGRDRRATQALASVLEALGGALGERVGLLARRGR